MCDKICRICDKMCRTCDKTRRSSDEVRRTCARPTTTIAAAITTTTVATSVAAAALPPANSTAPIAAALTTPTLPAAIPTPSLAASIAAASEPAAIAAATEHEAPEHEPPERRPEERKYTLGDVQRALRISVARPKLTGRAKPGIRSWRGRSSRAVAAGARCRSRAHVAGWRGRWQCTATRHSLPAARAAAARRTRCWLRVRRRLPPAARPPHVDEDDEIKEVVGAAARDARTSYEPTSVPSMPPSPPRARRVTSPGPHEWQVRRARAFEPYDSSETHALLEEAWAAGALCVAINEEWRVRFEAGAPWPLRQERLHDASAWRPVKRVKRVADGPFTAATAASATAAASPEAANVPAAAPAPGRLTRYLYSYFTVRYFTVPPRAHPSAIPPPRLSVSRVRGS